MTQKIITRLAFSSTLALTFGVYACSAGNTGELTPGSLSGGRNSSGGTGGSVPMVDGGSSGAAGSGAGTSAGGTTGGALGAGGGFIDPTLMGGTAGMGPVTEDAACGTGEASAMLKKVSMLIMFDRSWSMTQCANPDATPPMGQQDSLACTDGGPSRWDLTSQALTLFFQDATAADLNVGLRFFPDDIAGCTGFPTAPGSTEPNCDVNVCAVPLVDLGVLSADAAPVDAHEAALVAAVAASVPPGPAIPNPNPATPTSAALGGAALWATQYAAAHPEEQTVVVLVTDGEPFGCDTNADNIAAIAADVNMTSGVLTYAVGLTGASEMQLDQIATAGGTDQAFFVSDGGTATQELLAALLAIKGMALTCDFAVPMATSTGMDIDPHLINVNYTAGTGIEVELGLVGSMAECGTQQAWYYDDPANPTRIILCPAACSTVTTDIGAEIEILAGCEPRIPIAT